MNRRSFLAGGVVCAAASAILPALSRADATADPVEEGWKLTGSGQLFLIRLRGSAVLCDCYPAPESLARAQSDWYRQLPHDRRSSALRDAAYVGSSGQGGNLEPPSRRSPWVPGFAGTAIEDGFSASETARAAAAGGVEPSDSDDDPVAAALLALDSAAYPLAWRLADWQRPDEQSLLLALEAAALPLRAELSF